VNNWLNRLITESNGRPFTVEEAERIAEFSESLPDRLSAAKKLEESQKWLGKQLSEAVGPKAAEWGLPKDPFTNDFAQSLSAIVQAMLLDDLNVLKETVIEPFAALADALDVPREELGGLFTIAWHSLAKRLDPRSIAIMHPYFAIVARGLQSGETESLVDTPMPFGNGFHLGTADTPVAVEI
jgi:hypothetical protein